LGERLVPQRRADEPVESREHCDGRKRRQEDRGPDTAGEQAVGGAQEADEEDPVLHRQQQDVGVSHEQE